MSNEINAFNIEIRGEGVASAPVQQTEADAAALFDKVLAESESAPANEAGEDVVFGIDAAAAGADTTTLTMAATAVEPEFQPIIKPEEIRTDPTPTQSTKQQFDAAAAANLLDVDANKVVSEGGVYTAQGTNALAGDGDANTEAAQAISLEDKDDKQNMFELYGFSVSFIVPGTKNQLAGSRVRVYAKTLAELTLTVQGNVYTHVFADGSKLECRITEGKPRIAFDECEKLVAGDKGWERP